MTTVVHYLMPPLAALCLGLALYLWRRGQRFRAWGFVGGALVLFTPIHLAFGVTGILVLLTALIRGPGIVKS